LTALPEPKAVVVTPPPAVRTAQDLGLPPEAQAIADDLARGAGSSDSAETPPPTL
jgi:hypothetical protein